MPSEVLKDAARRYVGKQGRPKGSVNRRSQEILAVAATQGISPLEVMLNVMRKYYEEGKLDQAVEIAAVAAPFVHPRLAAVDHKSDGKPIGFVLAPNEAETVEQWETKHVPSQLIAN